jgi:hypothetical protein
MPGGGNGLRCCSVGVVGCGALKRAVWALFVVMLAELVKLAL